MNATMHTLSGLNPKNAITQLPDINMQLGVPNYYRLPASDPRAENRVLYIPVIGSHLSVHTSLTMLALDSLNNGNAEIIGAQIPEILDRYNYGSSWNNSEKILPDYQVMLELESGKFALAAQKIIKIAQNTDNSSSRLHIVGVGAGAAIAASVMQLSEFMYDNNQLTSPAESVTLIDPPNTTKRAGFDVESDMRQSLRSLRRAAKDENLGFLDWHYREHFGAHGLLGRAKNLAAHNQQYALPMNQALFRGFGKGKLSDDLEYAPGVEKLIVRSVGHTVCRSLESVKVADDASSPDDADSNDCRRLVEIEGLGYPIGMSPIAVAVIAKAGIQLSERA
jgi:predicted esterase